MSNDSEHEIADGCRRPLLLSTASSVTDVDPLEGSCRSLSKPLRFLYALNGLTISLPNIAFQYMVNTRTSMPLKLLSAYGAIAFLPFSFKPLYAVCSKPFPRDVLISALLATSGIAIAASALIPKDGVLCCFFMAFVRGVAIAWPEFLLGVTLVEQARRFGNGGSFPQLAATFQSQAATSRNAGSMVANVANFVIFAHRQYFAKGHELDQFTAIFILVLTAVLTMSGSIVACVFNVGATQEVERSRGSGTSFDPEARIPACDQEGRSDRRSCEWDSLLPASAVSLSETEGGFVSMDATSTSLDESFSTPWILVGSDVATVVLLQITIICIALKEPLLKVAGSLFWGFTVALLLISTLTSACTVKWSASHRVATYLVLKHAVPKSGEVMGSFLYSILKSTPILLQLKALINSLALIFSSWSFGKLFARYSAGWMLVSVIAFTTVLASIASFGDLAILSFHDQRIEWTAFLSIAAISGATEFVDEWQFLPSVVLASTNFEKDGTPSRQRASYSQHASNSLHEDETIEKDDSNVGLRYGTLVSCIDFGDQLGAWLSMPLISAMGISRDHSWTQLKPLVWVCAVAKLVSLVFVLVLFPGKELKKACCE